MKKLVIITVLISITIGFFVYSHYQKMKELHALAKQGETSAQLQLSDYYLEKNDKATAIEWLRKAANRGDTVAQHRLGRYYFSGENVEQNFHEAFNNLKKSAEQNHAESQILLGICYLNGLGVTKDFDEAIRWMQREYSSLDVDENLSRAVRFLNRILPSNPWSNFVLYGTTVDKKDKSTFLYRVGLSHYLGKGVKKDEESGIGLIKKAAHAGDKHASYNYAWVALLKGSNRESVLYLSKCDGTEEYELGNPKDAIRIALSRASKGDDAAQFLIGVNYYLAHTEKQTSAPKKRGYYWPSNKEGASWIEKAIKGGDPALQYKIGLFLAKQEFDWELCKEAFRASAEQGNIKAQYEFWTQVAKNGDSLSYESLEAFRWLETAGHNGYVDAQIELAKIYSGWSYPIVLYHDSNKELVGVSFNGYSSASIQSLIYHARFNNRDSNISLMDSCLESAFFWHKKAAEQNHADSQYYLGVCYLKGRGTSVDNRKAFSCFLSASEQGIVQAQTQLGKLYLSGDGGEHNIGKAIYWLRKAKEHGCEEAQKILSIL